MPLRSVIALGIVAAVYLVAAPTAHGQSTWNVASGNWNSAGNWLNGIPNDVGATAQYTGSVSATTTVDAIETVGTLTLGGSSNVSWTIAASSALTFNQDTAGSGLATISNTNASTGTNNALILSTGSYVLADNLTISNTNASNSNTTGSVQIIGTLSGAGNITINNAVSVLSQTGSIRFQTAPIHSPEPSSCRLERRPLT